LLPVSVARRIAELQKLMQQSCLCRNKCWSCHVKRKHVGSPTHVTGCQQQGTMWQCLSTHWCIQAYSQLLALTSTSGSACTEMVLIIGRKACMCWWAGICSIFHHQLMIFYDQVVSVSSHHMQWVSAHQALDCACNDVLIIWALYLNWAHMLFIVHNSAVKVTRPLCIVTWSSNWWAEICIILHHHSMDSIATSTNLHMLGCTCALGQNESLVAASNIISVAVWRGRSQYSIKTALQSSMAISWIYDI